MREPRLGRRCRCGSMKRWHDAVAAESCSCDEPEPQKICARPHVPTLRTSCSGPLPAHPTPYMSLLIRTLSYFIPAVAFAFTRCRCQRASMPAYRLCQAGTMPKHHLCRHATMPVCRLCCSTTTSGRHLCRSTTVFIRRVSRAPTPRAYRFH